MTVSNFHLTAEHTPRAFSALATLLCWIDRRFTRASQHAALSELDDHLLKDIGITREDVRRVRFGRFADLQPTTLSYRTVRRRWKRCRQLGDPK